jgi:hypothetical protein
MEIKVSIDSNKKETTFQSTFEMTVTFEEEKQKKIIYTELYKESENIPGIPARVPYGYIMTDTSGKPILFNPSDKDEVKFMEAIQTAANEYNIPTQESLEKGAEIIESIQPE